MPRLVDSATHRRSWRPVKSTGDISRGFIRAEVVRYEHLVARAPWRACREHGELRLEGKYIVLDGDVINFRHAT